MKNAGFAFKFALELAKAARNACLGLKYEKFKTGEKLFGPLGVDGVVGSALCPVGKF